MKQDSVRKEERKNKIGDDNKYGKQRQIGKDGKGGRIRQIIKQDRKNNNKHMEGRKMKSMEG